MLDHTIVQFLQDTTIVPYYVLTTRSKMFEKHIHVIENRAYKSVKEEDERRIDEDEE